MLKPPKCKCEHWQVCEFCRPVRENRHEHRLLPQDDCQYEDCSFDEVLGCARCGRTLSALSEQVGGDHYKGKKIQPVEYISANRLNFLEGCIVKRITRWRDKPVAERFQDLEKIKHEVDLLIEMEKHYG